MGAKPDTSRSILLIEDNKSQADKTSSYLESIGHIVKWAHDGASAIRLAASGRFDLVLLDLELPDMRGTQICQWLKQNSATRMTPVIILTSREGIAEKVAALEAGADDYLQKPWNELELKARIGAFLRTKALQDEISEKNHRLEELLAEVQKLAITDPLTGLYNRRHFTSILQNEFNKTMRYDTPLACVMADIDHFKAVNDRAGHASGDSVLVEVSRLLKKNIRNVDVMARWGGEEFIVLMPSTPREKAMAAAERMRTAVEKHTFDAMAAESLTISIGVSCLPDTPSGSPEQFVGAADTALYRAKQGGRNRVEYA